jgi:hypothetical protein
MESRLFRILVLGASGQFGKLLCRRLAYLPDVQLILGGRDPQKLETRKNLYPDADIEATACDINSPEFPAYLKKISPDLVIHLAGPFQGQDYGVAKACIAAGTHYIDMADGRDFVEHFPSLHEEAVARGVFLITGASTVPALSTCIIDNYLPQLGEPKHISYGISAGLKTGLGLATLKAVLSYCGKPYMVRENGMMKTIYGLDRPRSHPFPPPVWRRWVVDCDIPDHALLPKRYPSLDHLAFGSCISMPLLPHTLSLLSKAVQKGRLKDADFLAPLIEPVMNALKFMGDSNSGFFMNMQSAQRNVLFEIIAHDGAGLEIPVTPVIVLVKKLLAGQTFPKGATICQGYFTLDEFVQELSDYPITFSESIPS